MKNSSKPAFAITEIVYESHQGGGQSRDEVSHLGLTKLEHAAIQNMAGLLANKQSEIHFHAEGDVDNTLAKIAIGRAKDLFIELEKEA